ncbi:hypothetical protein K9857_15030 [Pseudomonas sp. REP124]|uniref:hypothetical protein n=1 Tax=Pseudomonas sp. REP124 TaxID=2875731 RepID=UPI001CC9EE7F|nr:hypothetical protein [Pseudomonas sp. REP124]MBZ9782852.1 hypothetical protein [Pseudomonas sp. REP124]
MSEYARLDPFAELRLPTPVHARALRLLQGIRHARTVADTLHAADRAEGFVMGLESLKALPAAGIEVLYRIFDTASQLRQVQLELERQG